MVYPIGGKPGIVKIKHKAKKRHEKRKKPRHRFVKYDTSKHASMKYNGIRNKASFQYAYKPSIHAFNNAF